MEYTKVNTDNINKNQNIIPRNIDFPINCLIVNENGTSDTESKIGDVLIINDIEIELLEYDSILENDTGITYKTDIGNFYDTLDRFKVFKIIPSELDELIIEAVSKRNYKTINDLSKVGQAIEVWLNKPI